MITTTYSHLKTPSKHSEKPEDGGLAALVEHQLQHKSKFSKPIDISTIEQLREQDEECVSSGSGRKHIFTTNTFRNTDNDTTNGNTVMRDSIVHDYARQSQAKESTDSNM